MSMKFDLDEALFPVCVVVVIIVFITQIASCSKAGSAAANEQIKIYLENGCMKQSIVGSSGTSWVCNNQTDLSDK